MMLVIKGYVNYYGQKIPVTWEEETERYAKDVRKVSILDNEIVIADRVFDDKLPKSEIEILKNHVG